MSEFNQARREGIVKFGYDFNTLAEVTHLFGRTATRLPYQISFRIPNADAICSLLSEDGGSGWKNVPHYGPVRDGRGWQEIVQIDEFNADASESAKRVDDELSHPLTRYVFWRMQRDGASWYKFYGVFRLDVSETEALRDTGTNICVYRKVSDEVTCPACAVSVSTVAAETFCELQGKTLTAQLLDEVAFEGTGGKDCSGTVKVWPGQTFMVERVSESDQMAVCITSNVDFLSQFTDLHEVRILVPKRDLELGYFSWDGRAGDIADVA
ncbi:MAG: hypothetical protein Q4G65_18040 [bacterium]|nr:hypothetical protein [bacterium]